MTTRRTGSRRTTEGAALARRAQASVDPYVDLFDFAPIGYAVLSGGGTIREINFAGALLLGRGRGAVVGRRLGGLVARGQEQRVPGILARAARSGRREATAVEVRRPDGTVRSVRLWATEHPRQKGSFLVMFEDVSERTTGEE